jgi:hypothetical protein
MTSASFADKYNPSYASYANKNQTHQEPHKSEYKELPNYSNQHVNGGATVVTRNLQ